MTNDELIALKELAQKAKPFTKDELFDREDTEEEVARRRANSEFFIAVHPVMPELIDELLKLRKNAL